VIVGIVFYIGDVERHIAHRFETTAHNDIGLRELNLLTAEHHTLHATSADFVHVCAVHAER